MASNSKLARTTATGGRYLAALLTISALLASQVAAHQAAQRNSSPASSFNSLAGTRRTPRFYVSGKVGRLYPGARKSMKIAIKNPNRYAIKLSWLSIRVLSSDTDECSSRWIGPKKRITARFLVPARARVFATLPVRLSRKAPDACKGARWPMRFRGEAIRKRTRR
jgi:hypothetical protein